MTDFTTTIPMHRRARWIGTAILVGLVALVALGIAPIPAAAAPATWPDTSIWPNTSSSDTYAYKMLVAGAPTPVRDLNGDQNPDSTDVSSHGTNNQIGDWNSTYFYATDTHLFFRMLLNDNPKPNQGDWDQYSWLVEIDVNGDGTTDWRVGIAGVDEQVYATCLTTGTPTTYSADPADGYTRQVSTAVTGPSSSKTMYYADWQIELSALNDGAGGCPDISPSTPIRLFYGTSANGQVGGPVNKDYFTGGSVDYTNMSYVSANEPLAVTLAAFTASATADGVTLAWETVSETDNAGFNVYRAENDAGPWVRLNAALIPAAAPGSSEGHAYAWTDATAEAGVAYWYQLEDVALDGALTRHAPVTVGAAAEPNAVGLASFGATVLPRMPRIERILPLAGLAALGLVALAGAGARRRQKRPR